MAKGKRRTLAGRIQDETDPEWKAWYQQVEWLRQRRQNPKYKPLVVSRLVVDGEERIVARKKSVPTPVKALVKNLAGISHIHLDLDLAAIRESWTKVVGDEIGADTAVYSFKKGILTIEVFSPTLFQELRMFHAKVIKKDLVEIWPVTMPLVEIKYRQGRKN